MGKADYSGGYSGVNLGGVNFYFVTIFQIFYFRSKV